MLTSTVGILYNKNIVEAVGWDVNNLPETWDELLQFAEDVKQYAAATGQEIWPVGCSAAMEETLNMTLFPLIWQAGGDILSESQAVPPLTPGRPGRLRVSAHLGGEGICLPGHGHHSHLEDYFIDGRLAVQFSVDAPQIDL